MSAGLNLLLATNCRGLKRRRTDNRLLATRSQRSQLMVETANHVDYEVDLKFGNSNFSGGEDYRVCSRSQILENRRL